MSEDSAKVEAFYAKDGAWREELLALRAILREMPLSEEFKWYSPVYTAHGGNVAIVWGFKDYCGLGFFKGALMKDPEGILVQQGENSRSARVMKFHGVDEIAEQDAVIRAYVAEAIANEKAGLKVDLPKDDLDYPEELVDRLDGDPEFRAAFEALTPGRQRGWVLHFSQPKQSKTRVSRIDKAAAKILAGKGMHDR
ncbi:YdeI/OmpD-associated family protein [Oricola indica]|uniref:YdeI/OmpD-associated family protein n=1 Tax=Oricola indica TaxID=2872591 RepID=UPI003CCBDCFA